MSFPCSDAVSWRLCSGEAQLAEVLRDREPGGGWCACGHAEGEKVWDAGRFLRTLCQASGALTGDWCTGLLLAASCARDNRVVSLHDMKRQMQLRLSQASIV